MTGIAMISVSEREAGPVQSCVQKASKFLLNVFVGRSTCLYEIQVHERRQAVRKVI